MIPNISTVNEFNVVFEGQIKRSQKKIVNEPLLRPQVFCLMGNDPPLVLNHSICTSQRQVCGDTLKCALKTCMKSPLLKLPLVARNPRGCSSATQSHSPSSLFLKYDSRPSGTWRSEAAGSVLFQLSFSSVSSTSATRRPLLTSPRGHSEVYCGSPSPNTWPTPSLPARIVFYPNPPPS